MQVIAREVRNYITPEGRNPFRQWLTQLQDKRTRANIQRRIARLQEGNFGDCKRLGSDLYELRINYGPGYRIYFGTLTSHIVICFVVGIGNHNKGILKSQKPIGGNIRRHINERNGELARVSN